MSELILDVPRNQWTLAIYAPDRFARGRPIKGEHNYGPFGTNDFKDRPPHN